ncbi:hypothetical protein L4D76_01180 [Photobacterium sagamiensis]|uniref:hypothetical protein n=1 Tax=Photobacterium sagamiensis TaxID=2910241 RepID=UPI003D0D2D6F
MTKVGPFFKQLSQEIFEVTITLFKVMIPIILILKVIEEMGGIILLSELLGPLMHAVGLPSEMGLVWATTLLTNIYAGLLVFINLDIPLTVAQVSILGSMMLLAHSLPVEVALARKAGVTLWTTLLVRIGGSLLFAWLLHLTYEGTNSLQQAAQVLWQQEQSTDTDYLSWALSQIENLAMIFVVISALLFTLKVLKLLGIERLMTKILSPLLRLLGISKEATNLTIIGVTLGLSYGGGLLINEAKKGHIPARDIFTAIMLLNLLHSLIEDTLLVLLIGADFNTIFWGRLIFAVLLVALIAAILRTLDTKVCERYLYRTVK